MIDNDLLVDVRKIAYGKMHWETNSQGETFKRKDKPKTDTYRGTDKGLDDIMESIPVGAAWLKPTRLQEYQRRGIKPDIWIPRLNITLNNGHSLEFSGDTAEKVWKAYKGYIFNR